MYTTAAYRTPFQFGGLIRSVANLLWMGVWFSLLGFGARWLAPWFARPKAWQVFDGLIGATMFVLSALLVRHALIGM